MRDITITLDPFEVVRIMECNLYKTMNQHATLYFRGRITTETEEKIRTMNLQSMPVELKIKDELGENTKLFVGIVKTLNIEIENEMRVLVLNCVSTTFLMDLKPKIRVFQNKATTYEDIIKYIAKDYQGSGYLITVGNRTPIGDLIIQYNETDFAFLKRLASHFNSSICPSYLQLGTKFSFGMPESSPTMEIPNNYILKKELREDLLNDADILPFSVEQGATVILVKTREIYEIGDFVTFKGQKYTINEVKSQLIGGEFQHVYQLRERTGLYQSRIHNQSLIGASINASVTEVAWDEVKVTMKEEGIQDATDWFAYSTVYSSPDGTGWYCMPEVSDSVRVHFPTLEEKEGYVISSVHKSESRTNPDHKSLKTKYGKEVLFTPSSLSFTNNKGMTIKIEDGEGITITSDKKVNINSGEKIEMTSSSDSVTVKAPQMIYLEQGGTKIRIKDKIDVEGAKMQME